MRAIDQHFELWIAEVERLVGRSIDRKHARDAFECYEPPTKALTPEEYAYELSRNMVPVGAGAAMWGDDGKIYLPGEPGYPYLQGAISDSDYQKAIWNTLPQSSVDWDISRVPPEPTRASREAPRIWKERTPMQRILEWIWLWTGTRP